MKKIPELEAYESTPRGDALVYNDIPNEVYHSEVGVSSSYVRKFGESQLHAIEVEQETTSAMHFGTAAHAMLVEGEEEFNKQIAVVVGSPYTKANKELKQEFIDRGLIVIKEREYHDIFAMRDNMIDEGNMYLNGNGKIAEASFFWYEGDVLCKCRPDVICSPQGPHQENDIVAVDYKTTFSCSPDAFKESVLKYGYLQQASWYRRGLQAAGYKVKEFVFVAQEKKPPYACKIFKITDKQMDLAWLDMSEYLEGINKILKGGKPTIYNSPNIVTLDFDEQG